MEISDSDLDGVGEPVKLSQLQTANRFRSSFHDAFPMLASAKDGIKKVLEESKKDPDGSVDALHRARLEQIAQAADTLLLALLFPT